MLLNEDNLERRKKRLEKSYPWDTQNPYLDIVWLSEVVQQTGQTLAFGLNLPWDVVVDLTLVSAAFFILQAWSHLDPEVESLLVSGR